MQTLPDYLCAAPSCPVTLQKTCRSWRAMFMPLLLTASALAAGPTHAQTRTDHWPDRAVRIIVPFSPGGATDIIGRALGQRLAALWKQSVVIENKTGAGGSVGAENTVRADADGYTLLLATGSMFTVNPFIYDNLPYTLDNFALISGVATGPMVVVVNPTRPINTLSDLVAYAHARPGQVNFGSAGVGTQTHMAAEQLAAVAALDVAHIPYKGESASLADLMAGHIDFAVSNIAAVTPLVVSGRLRALAVSGNARSPMLPDVPSALEVGQPDFQAQGWFALMAPAKTPQKIVARIQQDVHAALAHADTLKTLQAQGSRATPSTPAELAEQIRTEAAMWKTVVARRQLKNR